MVLFTCNVKKIKDTAYRTGDLDATCKRGSPFLWRTSKMRPPFWFLRYNFWSGRSQKKKTKQKTSSVVVLSLGGCLCFAEHFHLQANLIENGYLESCTPLLSPDWLKSCTPLLSADSLKSCTPLLSADWLKSCTPLLSVDWLKSCTPLLFTPNSLYAAPRTSFQCGYNKSGWIHSSGDEMFCISYPRVTQIFPVFLRKS